MRREILYGKDSLMRLPLPVISAWDPRATSSGSLDPLGALRAYTAIATTLLPGATTITTRPAILLGSVRVSACSMSYPTHHTGARPDGRAASESFHGKGSSRWRRVGMRRLRRWTPSILAGVRFAA